MAKQKHGQSRTGIYRNWAEMRHRCSNKKGRDYYRYGARGISVCERWNDFLAFSADMGPRPSPEHSIERIDNNGNYEPSNCRWATDIEQANNRRNTHTVEYQGQQMSVAEATRSAGVVTSSIAYYRIDRGWSVKAAVETPAAFCLHPVSGKRIYRSGYAYGEPQ